MLGLCTPREAIQTWHSFPCRLICFINLNITCSFISALIMTFVPSRGESYNYTSVPDQVNVSELAENLTRVTQLSQLADNLTRVTQHSSPGITTTNYVTVSTRAHKVVMERTVSDGSDIPRDSPTALVIASSVAAVCILVFFVIAYLWHTHQLDSRARKLAIRLAADSERAMNCRSCELQVSRAVSRPTPKTAQRVVSESLQEQNQYVPVTPEAEPGPGSDCGRSSAGIPESEAGDTDDVFEPIQFPPIVERGRVGIRGGRGSHRKFSRSRKTSSGANLDKRDSAVTDKEILTHFASRRHSTFFI